MKLEYRYVESKYEIKPLEANKMAIMLELWAGSGCSINSTAKNMVTYAVTSGTFADASHGRWEKNIKGAKK